MGSAVVVMGEGEELRMDSVGAVAESNGDGQAPGGAATGLSGEGQGVGANLKDEGNVMDSSGGEERG